MKKLPILISLLLLFTGVVTAGATTITLNGAPLTFSATETIEGYEYADSATFSLTSGISYNTLTLVLTNTSSQAAPAPAQALSAVFWNSATVLSPFSAALTSGSTWVNPKNVELNIGGNYRYDGALPLTGDYHAPANQGVSGVGINLFGKGNFGGTPAKTDGDAYDILPQKGIAEKSTNNFDKKYPLANDSMTFTFHTGAASLDIGGVTFHYSSAYEGLNLTVPDVPNPPAVPIPPTAFLLGSGLLGLGLIRFRRREKKA
jgi:hypothetical protein